MGKFPEIKQDLQMLEQMLINTHDKSLYQRLRLLVLIATDSVRSQQQAAQILSVHYNTISGWLERYRTQSFDEYISTKKTGPRNQRSLSDEVYCALADRLNAEGFTSFGQLHKWVNQLQEQRGEALTKYSTLNSLYQAHFGAKAKVIRPEHPKKTTPSE